jgi:DNA-directed RNA polymerase specialized sigma24 family protein
MSPDDLEGSVTRWISALKAGDQDAAQPLWERYFDRLVRLARAKLRESRPGGADADEEDAALSAFNAFCRGAAAGRYPQLSDRDDLWRLLVTITAGKTIDQARRRGRHKRGGGRVVNEADLPAPGDTSQPGGLEDLAGPEPSPEFAALVVDQYRRLLHTLPDDGLRQVAVWRMEGYTVEEIATRLGCARRTVAYRLELIRATWQTEVPP